MNRSSHARSLTAGQPGSCQESILRQVSAPALAMVVAASLAMVATSIGCGPDSGPTADNVVSTQSALAISQAKKSQPECPNGSLPTLEATAVGLSARRAFRR